MAVAGKSQGIPTLGILSRFTTYVLCVEVGADNQEGGAGVAWSCVGKGVSTFIAVSEGLGKEGVGV